MVKQIVGNAKARERLNKILPEARVILLSGPAGVGKFTVAEQAALAVADPGDVLSHRGSLAIDYIRDIIEQAYFQASGTKGRAFILECDEYSQEAMNAMLKILEEPPKNVYFFLVSSTSLPSTIVSRCQKVSFGSMTAPEVREALVGASWSFTQADRYCHTGSVGAAMQEYALEEARTNMMTYLEACRKQEWDLILRCVPSWGQLELECLVQHFMMRASKEPDHRVDHIALANFFGRRTTCPMLVLINGARHVIAKKVV